MTAEKKKYIGISIILILLALVFSSGCVDLTCAYVKDSAVTDGWYENTALRNTGMQFLGLEKWCSSTYEINGKYPASLTVTTLKTLVLTDEKEIQKKTRETIEETFLNSIQLNENTSGERTLQNNHKTMYILYDGIDTKKDENVKIIGEVWNCGTSGASIICIGVAYVTNKEIPDVENTDNWQKIVMDPSGTIDSAFGEQGLIDNVHCH
jgi:hypothetical protein